MVNRLWQMMDLNSLKDHTLYLRREELSNSSTTEAKIDITTVISIPGRTDILYTTQASHNQETEAQTVNTLISLLTGHIITLQTELDDLKLAIGKKK